ncbi:Tat pathway signal protein [Streptomyces syringium]|uniref:Tat pathway signal protein n=1 Tax=Streptomyces syringium TaxID=76729 RepID=UPI00343FC263
MSHAELAEQINDAVEGLTGRRGNASDRTIRRYLSGETRWPQARQRVALEVVFETSATELGFTPPVGTAQGGAALVPRMQYPNEESVRRRAFITATTGTVLSTTALTGAARLAVGTADVQRLRGELAALWLMDDREGGGPTLENHALALSRKVMSFQQNGSATQRVRGRLYGLAAASTATAMWAAVVTRHLARAQQYMESAVVLAGLSGDGQVQHEVWRYVTALARQRGHWSDAVSAAEATMGTSVHRSDPLYASLGHARLALCAADRRDHARVRRALGRAASAFERADLSWPRPASMAFCTRAELDGVTGIALLGLGDLAPAECHLHRCLAGLRPEQHRNRALYNGYLALAQLRQGDLSQACATAAKVNCPSGVIGTGAVPHLLRRFTIALNVKAPGAQVTRDWNERARSS